MSTLVGEVLATPQSGQKSVKYSILSGGYGWFEMDAVTGAIASSGTVDREILLSVLLNVQAEAGNPPVYSTAQVNTGSWNLFNFALYNAVVIKINWRIMLISNVIF